MPLLLQFRVLQCIIPSILKEVGPSLLFVNFLSNILKAPKHIWRRSLIDFKDNL